MSQVANDRHSFLLSLSRNTNFCYLKTQKMTYVTMDEFERRFYILMALGCRLSRQFHNSLWTLKVTLGFGALLIGALFLPAPVIAGYVWVARGGAAIFVVLQMVVIVDLAYSVNDWFVSKSNASDSYSIRSDSGSCPQCGSLDDSLSTLLYLSVFLFASALTGLVLLFVYYSECPTTTAFVAMTLVLCVGERRRLLFPCAFANNSQGDKTKREASKRREDPEGAVWSWFLKHDTKTKIESERRTRRFPNIPKTRGGHKASRELFPCETLFFLLTQV